MRPLRTELHEWRGLASATSVCLLRPPRATIGFHRLVSYTLERATHDGGGAAADQRKGASVTEEELRELFAPLHDCARTLALQVLEHEEQPAHPCAYMVRDAFFDPKGERPLPSGWFDEWYQHWQLPEPFIGEVVGHQPFVAFVGLNPSIDEREGCPRIESELDDWLGYWRKGFDAGGRFVPAVDPVPLYEEYQQLILRPALGADATLGREAIVTDAAHFKCLSPFGSVTTRRAAALRAALEHDLSVPLTLRFLDKLSVSVVVTVGGDSTRSVGGALVPALRKAKITAVHGRAYRTNSGVTVVPALHRNARAYPASMRAAVASAIRAAVEPRRARG